MLGLSGVINRIPLQFTYYLIYKLFKVKASKKRKKKINKPPLTILLVSGGYFNS